MEIVSLTADLKRAWDDLCLESDDAWFWHTTSWIDYTVAWRDENENASFLVTDDTGPIAVCPLVLEWNANGRRELSFGGNPCPWLAVASRVSDKQRLSVTAAVIDEIDRVATKYDVVRASFRAAPL